MASIRSVEDALQIEVPKNAQLIRNLMIGAQYIHDHVMHFYHLHALDWVDIVSALNGRSGRDLDAGAEPVELPELLAGLLRRRAEEGEDLRRAGPAGHLRQGLLGPPGLQAAARGEPHGGGALPRRTRLAARRRAAAHDLRRQEPAPELRRRRHAERDRPRTPTPRINQKRLSQVQDVINRMRSFVDQVYVPDTLAIASFYKDWGAQGEGLGNFLCFGDLPMRAAASTTRSRSCSRAARS